MPEVITILLDRNIALCELKKKEKDQEGKIKKYLECIHIENNDLYSEELFGKNS